MSRSLASTTLADETDDNVMCRVQAGEVAALGILFERHQTPLLSFFLRMGTPRALGEDMVQDVFVRILKYRASYRAGSRFATWMYYIARNARLDAMHKRRGEVDWDDAYAPMIGPVDNAQSNQELQLLEKAMQALPEEKRELLVLARYQEMRYDEIGALLGCETSTVKVRVHRAMRELRGHYENFAQRTISGGTQ